MTQKEQWASRLGLVLAMAGNAVGLGNFLRFPAEAARNGGGAFLIPYIVALLVLGLPLMWVEWSMGRYGGQFGHHSAPGIFQSMGRSRLWKYFGAIGLWSCLVIASFYLYVESWCLAYAGYSAIGGFTGKSVAEVREFFQTLTGEHGNNIIAVSPWGMGIFAICVIINIFILSRGLARGIELVAKIGMPLLIIFAIILAIRGLMIQPDDPGVKPGESPLNGLNFVWKPVYDRLDDPAVWLAAAGQIFFTLSIGMGSIHCYSSYLRAQDDVALTGATTAWTNEFCEVVLGGTILIPIATAYLGLQEVQSYTQGGSGFGLGFFVFPTLFNNWGWFAPVAGFMWFGLLFFAAITSSLAMGQPVMAFMQQEFGMSRERSALAFALCLLPLAIPVAVFHSHSFQDEFNYWAGTVMLVVFALGETILFAWVFGMQRGWAEIVRGAELKVPMIFFYVIKYITPVLLMLILAAFIFRPQADWRAYVQAAVYGKEAPKWEWGGNSLIGLLMHKDLDEERAAALEALDKKDAGVRDDAKLTPTEKDQKLQEIANERKRTITYYEQLPLLRNADRLLMVGAYLFFALLIYIAWLRRSREGRA